MDELNPSQGIIASSLTGMIVVDAGPGTGKTLTVVRRYLNILGTTDLDPRDVILMTFTNNAAEEMKARLEEGLDGKDVLVQTSTFDAFCLRVVMDSAESVTEFLGMKERLTRGAGIVQNDTLNYDHFMKVYTRFMNRSGHRYRNVPALTSSSPEGLYKLIEKLMSKGIMPLPDYDWFGSADDVLEGRRKELLSVLRDMNTDPSFLKSIRTDLKDKNIFHGVLSDDTLETVPDDILSDAVDEDRRHLIWLIHDVYYEYLRASISENRLTFGMTALFALATLYHDDSARRRFSYRYVMIDEFQDTNEIQMKMSLLILKEPNLCVVGDWKQGIYGFRNASVTNITEFDRKMEDAKRFLNKGKERISIDIPTAVRHPLLMNYRSSQKIIDAAFSALTVGDDVDAAEVEKNLTRISAAREDIRDRTEIELLTSDSAEEEALSVLAQIQRYLSDPRYIICADGGDRRPRYGDIAVLCRNGSMCRAVHEAAIEHGIPAYLQADAEIMSTREGKLALAWLRYVNNRKDAMGTVAILNYMGYSLSEIEAVMGTDMPPELSAHRKSLVRKKRRPNDLLTSIFEFHGLNNDTTQSIISVLSDAHRGSLLTIPDLIRLMEEDIKRSTRYQTDALLDKDAVTIQTIHKSKGLEYPIVILAGVNARTFPSVRGDPSRFRFGDLYGVRSTYEYLERDGYHSIAGSWRWAILKKTAGTDRDEERRLLFVALSRAKQYITMTAHEPSVFMKAFGEKNFRKADTHVRAVSVSSGTVPERPRIGDYVRRRTNMSVHDIMGMTSPSGKGDEVGKGTDHGRRVHEAAELLATGRDPKEEFEELDGIRRILDSLKGADLLTEVECSLPVGDVTLRGVIDLLAVYPDRAEVHDYKTDVDESNIDRYRIQLSVYVAAVSAYLGKRTEGYVDFVSLGTVRRVDPMTPEEISSLVDSVRT